MDPRRGKTAPVIESTWPQQESYLGGRHPPPPPPPPPSSRTTEPTAQHRTKRVALDAAEDGARCGMHHLTEAPPQHTCHACHRAKPIDLQRVCQSKRSRRQLRRGSTCAPPQADRITAKAAGRQGEKQPWQRPYSTDASLPYQIGRGCRRWFVQRRWVISKQGRAGDETDGGHLSVSHKTRVPEAA